MESKTLYQVFHQVIRLNYHRSHMMLDKIGIYPGQPAMLFVLDKKDGQSQKELSNKLGIKPATITVMLGRMEKNQLIERKTDEKDQRISRVYLTEDGKKILEEVKEVMKIVESECFDNFTLEEKVLLRRLLMQIKDNLTKVCDKKAYI